MVKPNFINENAENIILLVGLFIFAIIVIKVVFTFIANMYVKLHRSELLEKTKTLSDKCITDGNKLIENLEKYNDYIEELGFNQRFDCSSSIVANASNNVVKYLVKYTDIDYDEYSIQRLDYCINWMHLFYEFLRDMEDLSRLIKSNSPIIVKLFASSEKLPYKVCDIQFLLTKIMEPKYVFAYVSPAGKIERKFEVMITEEVLVNIRNEIYTKINKKGQAKQQRSAMTNDLREAIKRRDNYTCCICGNSVFNEPNLLLEVDHIVPIAKGGKTEADNLQTLCWRCNREKRDK